MLLPETGAAYSAPLSSSWLSELFSSVYSSGSCGRLYRSVGEKEKSAAAGGQKQKQADRCRQHPLYSLSHGLLLSAGGLPPPKNA